MKIRFLILFVLLANGAISQSYSYLDLNNVSARISDNGVFFEDPVMSVSEYEVPKGANTTAIYAMSFWMAGLDANSQLATSCSKYHVERELSPGPISDDYNSSYYTTTFLTSMWSVTKAEIDDHIANYASGGYTMPASIEYWPGNGNVSEGVAAKLAPYYDMNSNGVYDPANGDYPYIEGDKATLVILNDENITHNVSGGNTLGVEVHVMFYQFATSDDLNNTTFFNVNVYNRSSQTISDFKFGIYADFDLGNFQDDYWGSDSTRNYMFVYNGDGTDESNGGAVGYGTNPPAVGIVSLSHELNVAVAESIQSASTAADFNNLLNGLQPNSAPFMHSSGYPTKFQYSDNPNGTGFNENDLGNPSGDRRALMAIAPSTLQAGDNLCMDYAIVYKRDMSFSNLENAEGLIDVVDFVQNYYDTEITPCAQVVASTTESYSPQLEVFPNPSNGFLTVKTDQAAEIIIVDLNGQVVYQGQHAVVSKIQLDVAPGVYLLRVLTNDGVFTEKIELY